MGESAVSHRVAPIFWLEQRACDVPGHDDWLSASEIHNLRRLRVSKRRADWRLGRWTAKRAVAAYLNLPAEDATLAQIEIRAARSGAPEAVMRGRAAPVSISLSHRAGTALCAVAAAGTVLGCDLEVIEPRGAEFLADFFTEEEQARVKQAPAEDRDRILTLLWSAKESVLKALQVGLRVPTRTVWVWPLGASQPSAWEPYYACTTTGAIFHGWWREQAGLLRTVASDMR